MFPLTTTSVFPSLSYCARIVEECVGGGFFPPFALLLPRHGIKVSAANVFSFFPFLKSYFSSFSPPPYEVAEENNGGTLFSSFLVYLR